MGVWLSSAQPAASSVCLLSSYILVDCARNARAWSHCINGGNYHGKKVVFIHRTCIIEMVLQFFFIFDCGKRNRKIGVKDVGK